MISHAQNFEDVILWRALKSVGNGSYIDIGAHDPVADSISLSFYERGWRGIHVEPTPLYAQMLREARPDEVVIQAAVGSESEPIVFWVFPGTGLSTGDPAIAAGHQAAGRECLRIQTPCIPLWKILDEQEAKGPIHWLKIDVEGMEASVIASWAPSKVRPWIVVVESTMPGTTVNTYDSWEPALLQLGYEFVYFDGLNRFYVSAEQSGLKPVFGPGPNIFDGFQLNESSAFNQQLKADLVWRNNEIQRLNQDLGASIVLANDRAAAMVAAASAWETAADAFEGAKAKLQGEIADQVERLNQKDGDIASLRNDVASAQHDIAALQNDVVFMQQEHAGLRLTNLSLRQENATLRQQNAALQNRLTHLEEEVGAKAVEIQALTARSAQREGEAASIQAKLRSAQSDLAATRSELWAVKAEPAAAQEQLAVVRASTAWPRTDHRARNALKPPPGQTSTRLPEDTMPAPAPPLQEPAETSQTEPSVLPPVFEATRIEPPAPPLVEAAAEAPARPPVEAPQAAPRTLSVVEAPPTPLSLRARQIFADFEAP